VPDQPQYEICCFSPPLLIFSSHSCQTLRELLLNPMYDGEKSKRNRFWFEIARVSVIAKTVAKASF